MDTSNDVRTLSQNEAPEAVDVLTESFYDYPVMRFVLGPIDNYSRQLKTLIHFFVMARFYRRETVLGLGDSGRLMGTALIACPHRPAASAELDQLREEVWRVLGDEARARYESFGVAHTPFLIEAPHFHLSMIGVRGEAQGQGVGRRLIDHIHAMSLKDPESTGISLTTEDEANVSLYEYLGYNLIGRARVSPDVTTWVFFRPDPSSSTRRIT